MDNKMPIKFLAQNKLLLIEVVEENNPDDSGIVLPEDYKKNENPFKIGQILNVQQDSQFYNYIGSYVLFPSNALEEISVHGLNVKMVPSHAVYGVLQKEDEKFEVEVTDKTE